jgi:SAM-dependent methyltransferase
MASDKEKLPQSLVGIAALYSKNLIDYGRGPKSVGWKDEASQRLRFEKLAGVIDMKTGSEGVSVNDLGCGYGAMFQYLDQMPSLRLTRYYGYDISEEMLAEAKQFVADPRTEFIKSPRATHKADYSFVSGTFHVKQEASDELWTDYIKEMLIHLADMSKRGFAYNAITTYVDWKQEDLYYADPFLFFDFCKRNISRYVSLLHDYPLFEWTMIVHKESVSGTSRLEEIPQTKVKKEALDEKDG